MVAGEQNTGQEVKMSRMHVLCTLGEMHGKRDMDDDDTKEDKG